MGDCGDGGGGEGGSDRGGGEGGRLGGGGVSAVRDEGVDVVGHDQNVKVGVVMVCAIAVCGQSRK